MIYATLLVLKQTLNRFVDTLRLYCGVTYFLCRLSVTPGDVRALGDPLIGVCCEAPWVVGAVRVAAVVLPEVSATNTQRGFNSLSPLAFQSHIAEEASLTCI